MSNLQAARDTIDIKRREVINQKLKAAQGEVSAMYYEGMRVGMTECQNTIEKFLELELKKDPGD